VSQWMIAVNAHGQSTSTRVPSFFRQIWSCSK